VSGMYECALAPQWLDARRQRFRERQRVLLAVLAVTTVVFFALFVR
jgi:type VI protein secretion system component VasF